MSTIPGRGTSQDHVRDLADRKKAPDSFNDSGYTSFCTDPAQDASDNISLVDEEFFKPLLTSERVDGTATQVNNLYY